MPEFRMEYTWGNASKAFHTAARIEHRADKIQIRPKQMAKAPLFSRFSWMIVKWLNPEQGTPARKT